MNTILTLTKSSGKMFLRNRQALFFTLFMPTIIMVLLGMVGFDRTPKIDVGLVTNKPTPATQQFVDQLKKLDVLNIKAGDETSERAALKKGDRAVVLLVPDNLMPDLAAKTPPAPQTLKVLTNISRLAEVQTVTTILNQILDKTTLAVHQTPSLFEIKTEAINAKSSKYIDFLLPGLVAMSIMQMAVFSVAFVFADYKEKGILKRLLATPMKPFQFVTANVFTRLIVALVQSGILLGIGVWLFHSHIYGAWWLILLVAILGAVMFLGLGFTISGLASTVETVPALANLFVFPMLFLSGVFFPTNAMPSWLQSVVNYLPLTHFAHAMREVVGNGSGLTVIAHDLYWMIGWAAVLVFLANLTFGFEEKRI